MQPTISLVIPTFNMAQHLNRLWFSFVDSGLVSLLKEVIFVDDGSTDSTIAVLEQLSAQCAEHREKMKIVSSGRNEGRFLARYRGAVAAIGDLVLFLDSRNYINSEFTHALKKLITEHQVLIGHVDIDVTRNVYCLYWDRSHRRIFAKHFRDSQRRLWITKENYDQYLKGTTVFVSPRSLFLECCSSFLQDPPLNDDTVLLKEVVKRQPLLLDPSLRITWVPRENSRDFLKRMWERGPSFVEYHVFKHQGVFFYVVLAGLVGVFCFLIGLIIMPGVSLGALLFGLSAVGLSVFTFSRSPLEAVKMMPLHIAVVLTFGTAILYGLYVNLTRQVNFERV
jgi:glycosyltransferase involved in cell wall biosynthesis